MKSRKFTKPAKKPKQDEIVQSMSINTYDIIPEDAKMAREAEEDMIYDNEDCRASDPRQRAPVVQ